MELLFFLKVFKNVKSRVMETGEREREKKRERERRETHKGLTVAEGREPLHILDYSPHDK